jgi:hypothetical protein
MDYEGFTAEFRAAIEGAIEKRGGKLISRQAEGLVDVFTDVYWALCGMIDDTKSEVEYLQTQLDDLAGRVQDLEGKS